MKKGVLLALILMYQANANSLQTGDLIFRNMSGLFSEIARNFSTHDRRFSHLGIIYIENNQTFVVHSIDDTNKGFFGTVKEPLTSFIAKAKQYKVFRLQTLLQPQKMATILKKAVSNPKSFDSSFSLENAQAYYCTEFVQKVLLEYFDTEVVTSRTRRYGRDFISIEDVLHIKGLKPL